MNVLGTRLFIKIWETQNQCPRCRTYRTKELTEMGGP